MPLTDSLSAYLDVREILDMALDQEGGTYVLDTPQEATRWRARANYFRKLLRKADGASPYDHLTFRVEKNRVYIVTKMQLGQFIPGDGQ